MEAGREVGGPGFESEVVFIFLSFFFGLACFQLFDFFHYGLRSSPCCTRIGDEGKKKTYHCADAGEREIGIPHPAQPPAETGSEHLGHGPRVLHTTT